MRQRNNEQEKIIRDIRIKTGLFIQQKRKEKKLSYYALGKMAGLTIGQIHNIEEGNSAYTLDSFIRIMDALNVSISIQSEDTPVKLL